MRPTEIVPQAPRGTLSAFHRLTADHQLLAYNLAYRLLGDERSAAAVVEQSVLRVAQRAAEAEDGLFLHLLLCAIIHAAQEWPQRDIRKERVGMEPVQQALNQLLFEQRVILSLADICGLTRQEIASVLEVSEQRVTRMLSQARVSLRDLWFGQRNHTIAQQQLQSV